MMQWNDNEAGEAGVLFGVQATGEIRIGARGYH